MYDDQEIGAELHRMAAADPLDPIDPHSLLARGRRGRRRRHVISVSGVVAGVAAIALAATLMPNLGQAGTAPAGTATARTPSAGTASTGSGETRTVADTVNRPMPGAPKGDAALAMITSAEALRRCRVQWAIGLGKDPGPIEVLSGQPASPDPLRWWPGSLLIVGDVPARLPGYFCVIGGDLLPGTAELAEVAEKSIRTDDQSILRRCSAMVFHDLRRWKVLSKSIQQDAFGTAVAVSPSGKYVAHCYLGTASARKAAYGLSGQNQIIQQWPVPAKVDGGIGYAGIKVESAFQTCKTAGLPCEGWLYHSASRLPLEVAKLTLEVGGKRTTVPVRQGWYALAWAAGSQKPAPERLTATAYRADGSVIKKVITGPIHMRR